MRAALRSNFDLTRRAFADRFLLMLAVVLLGYALDGRGFAYIGVPPVYIGEITLAVGLFAFLMTRGWLRVLKVPAAVAVLPLVAWGCIRLVPGVEEYQIDALRDAVVFIYSAFALFVATAIIADPERLPKLIAYYGRFTKIFLVLIPVVFATYRFASPILPRWPWGGGATIISEKEGDVLVHLSGILAFWMSDPKRKVHWIWGVLLTMNMALMGVIDRAGLLAFGVVMVLCLAVNPRHRAGWQTIGMLACGAVLLWASAFRMEVPGGKGREVSFDQFWVSVKSMAGSSENNGLDSTKEWRIEWWNKIIDYTVHGPYFWTGKGFGVNLATEDGFQVQADQSLRSPHSIHMTMLARLGVPGVVVWAFMHAVWLLSVADAYYRARRRKQASWAGLFLFLFAYYLAFMINGSFDVFIEGPMGGVWFWTIFGTGVGALYVHRTNPQVLADNSGDANGGIGTDEDSRRTQFLPAAGWRRPGLPVGAGASGIVRA